jgi:hypothetical protein
VRRSRFHVRRTSGLGLSTRGDGDKLHVKCARPDGLGGDCGRVGQALLSDEVLAGADQSTGGWGSPGGHGWLLNSCGDWVQGTAQM